MAEEKSTTGKSAREKDISNKPKTTATPEQVVHASKQLEDFSMPILNPFLPSLFDFKKALRGSDLHIAFVLDLLYPYINFGSGVNHYE